jgi:hypothetical protein
LEKLLTEQVKIKEENPDMDIIPMNKIVKVQSLYNGELTLKTADNSASSIFKFNFYGDTKPIFYSDLVKCISFQNRFFIDGFVYILDKEVIDAHYLTDYYKHLLSKDEIDKFLDLNEDEIKSTYKDLPVQQKIAVLERVAIKLNNDNSTDRNKIDIVSQISQFNINELAQKLK